MKKNQLLLVAASIAGLALGLSFPGAVSAGAQIRQMNAPAFNKNGISQTQGTQADLSAYDLVTSQVFLPLVEKEAGEPPLVVAPTLIAPDNGASLDTLIPLFKWQNATVPDLTNAHLEIALEPGFAQITERYYTRVSTTPQSLQFTKNFNPSTTYYWRMWYEINGQAGPYSEVRSFTTGANGLILPAPSLTSPENGGTVSGPNVTLSWAMLAGADEYLLKFTPQGGSGFTSYWTVSNQQVVHLQPGVYDWWVAARNSYAIGADSPIWQVTVTAQSSANSEQSVQYSIRALPDATEQAIR
jgi:hypothetical protein